MGRQLLFCHIQGKINKRTSIGREYDEEYCSFCAAVRFLLRVHAPDGAACSADVSASGAAAACAASGGHASSANLASCDRRREFQLPENGRPCAFFRKARPPYGSSPDRTACSRALHARRVPGRAGHSRAAADGQCMARSSGAAAGGRTSRCAANADGGGGLGLGGLRRRSLRGGSLGRAWRRDRRCAYAGAVCAGRIGDLPVPRDRASGGPPRHIPDARPGCVRAGS